MSKVDKEKMFLDLSHEYQKCLNSFYDRFLNGEDVKIDMNTCSEYKKNLVANNLFKPFVSEWEDFQKKNKLSN